MSQPTNVNKSWSSGSNSSSPTQAPRLSMSLNRSTPQSPQQPGNQTPPQQQQVFHQPPPQQYNYSPQNSGHYPPPQQGYQGPPPQQQGYQGPPQQQGYQGPPPQQQQGYYPPPQQNHYHGPPPGQGPYGPPPGQGLYGPPPGQGLYGPPPGQGLYGPPPGQVPYGPPPVMGQPLMAPVFVQQPVPVNIMGNKLVQPMGSSLVQPVGEGHLIVRVISARNLEAKDINGKSDPYVKIKARGLGSVKVTGVKDRELDPVWNETCDIKLDAPTKTMLVFDVYDHDLVGNDDIIGYVGVNLSLLPMGVEVITDEKLSYCKKGSIQIGLTALNFGVANYPPSYPMEYVTWRNTVLTPITHAFAKSVSKKLPVDIDFGPYENLEVHKRYRIVNGYLKRKLSKRRRTANAAGNVAFYTLAIGLTALGS